MNITNYKRLCSEGKILWSTHALKRLQERGITVDDVKSCIMSGEIIEEYPNDFPHPSALIFGYDLNEKIIHVVCGTDEKFLFLVTAYVPTTEKFMEDRRTRRQR